MYLEHDEVGEVIVVIDGSSDGTLEYIRSASAQDERIRYVDNVINRGLPYSRNKGNELARCKYIFCAEDDLIIPRDLFKVLVAHMNETKSDLISPREIFTSEEEGFTEAVHRTDKLKGDPVNKRTIVAQTGMGIRDDQEQLLLPAPMLGRAEIFREIKFDEGYIVNFWREESDFQFSAQERGYKLVSCPHVICYNVTLEDDRTGAHAAAGIKRVQWVVRNNWRFVRKHRKFIEQNFEIGNPYLYIARFAVRRTFSEIVLPVLISTKRKTRDQVPAFVSRTKTGPAHSSSKIVYGTLGERTDPPPPTPRDMA